MEISNILVIQSKNHHKHKINGPSDVVILVLFYGMTQWKTQGYGL